MSEKQTIIKQSELEGILRKRAALADAKAALKKVEADLQARETAVYNQLKEGAICKGKLVASIEATVGDCRPPWKDLYIGHMVAKHKMAPKAAEEEMRSKYPGKPGEQLAVGYAK
jgi:hypothetical protein